MWSIIQEVKDPVLRNLAAQLPQTVLSSRANSTTNKYLYAYSRWRNWVDQIQVPTGLPVSETYLVLYMQHLSATTNSRSAVETIVNAINWAHELAGHSSISKSPIVSATLKGLQRSLAKPTVKKEPVTPEMLHRMVNSMDSKPKLSQVRLVTVALIAYAAFLRYDELAKIRCCDVKFLEDCMMIYITSSKTDQYREGASLTVARTGLKTCPVAMTERYFAMAKLEHSSQEKIFRAIVVTKEGEKLRRTGTISYTRLRELLLARLQELGYNSECFGLHSLRAGGASAAANAGISDRLFKRHGCWRSETAKDGYIKDSLESRLSVSKNLGL